MRQIYHILLYLIKKMTQIIMTAAQLDDLVNNVAAKIAECKTADHTQTETPKHYVYGLRGIRELFGVSHPTAQKYKNTFLAPAIKQRGRVIVVDADMAVNLFNQYANGNG